MYCELFQLKEPPFRLTPDPQFLFASKQHARAKAYMESTIWLADGFVVITGDIGAGKTTLIESFLAELPKDVVLAHINQTQLSPVEFLQALLVEFGFQPYRMRKIELLTMVRDFMVQQYAEGKKVLLVIDEAQNLSRTVLEEVRMLSGIEAQKEKLLRIILAGQPELAAKLDSPSLAQLTQRVRLRFHLSALSKRETREYIEHRLEVAGAGGRKIFEDDAFDVVFRYSGGIPRLTNVLCDTAMLCAFAEERPTVDARLVKDAADELQWVEYAERIRERDAATGEYHGVAAASAPSATLDLYFQDRLVSQFALPRGRTIIGRTADNDLQIRSKFVSRHHAQITRDRGTCVIEDLNSTNGLFIGSRRVKHYILHDGDVVQLGEHKLVYREGPPSTASDGVEDAGGDDTEADLDSEDGFDAQPDAASEADALAEGDRARAESTVDASADQPARSDETPEAVSNGAAAASETEAGANLEHATEAPLDDTRAAANGAVEDAERSSDAKRRGARKRGEHGNDSQRDVAVPVGESLER